jgi:hypothetical protein
LGVVYGLSDSGAVGPPSAIVAINFAAVYEARRSDAWVELAMVDGPSYRRPWESFNRERDLLLKHLSNSAAITGDVRFTSDEVPIPETLARYAYARTRVVLEDGTVLSQGVFDLRNHAAVERLAPEALAKAREKARTGVDCRPAR